MGPVVTAKRSVKLPVVMTRGEVAAVLSKLRGGEALMVSLLYGGGLCSSVRAVKQGCRHRSYPFTWPRHD